MRRIGVRMRAGSDPVAGIFGRNLGEDWVVPREAIDVLLVQETSGGALLTAFGPGGQLVAERFAADFDVLAGLLDALHAAGAAAAPRVIPPGVASPRRHLLGEDREPGA